MLKLLIMTIATTIASQASVSEEELVKYFKKFIVKNPSVQVLGVEVLDVVKVPEYPGWEVYLTNMKLRFNNEEVSAPQSVFVNGTLFTPMLVDMATGMDFARDIKPKVAPVYYDEKHLIAGNGNAKHKILIFSDPQCPFCMEVVPEIIKSARAYPETFAVYYYHLPLLQIHPVSGILVRAMRVAQDKGQNEIVEKIYALKINPAETNEDVVLGAIKDQTGFGITKEEINAQSIKDEIKADEKASGKLMVSGTPTVYIDGVWDKMRDGYKKLVPQK